MSKQRKNGLIINNKIIIIAIIISGVILLCTTVILKNNPTPAFIESRIILAIYVLIASMLIVVSGLSFIVFTEFLIIKLINDYIDKKKCDKNLVEIKKLSNEFSKVNLKDYEDSTIKELIPQSEIKCIAKLDENSKVIYKIQIDIESSTEDYNLFLEHFEI